MNSGAIPVEGDTGGGAFRWKGLKKFSAEEERAGGGTSAPKLSIPGVWPRASGKGEWGGVVDRNGYGGRSDVSWK